MLLSQSKSPKTQYHRRSDLIEGAGFPNSSQELAVKPRNTNDPNRYYAILGVTPWASIDEIKRVYRREAKIYHPDGSRPDAMVFEFLTQVYETLIDPVKRQEYDSVPKGYTYVGEMEKRSLRERYGIDAIQEIVVEDIDKPLYFSYYGEVGQNEHAQEWYAYLLDALYATGLKTIVRISIQEAAVPHIDKGIIVIPMSTTPSYLIALRLVRRLGGKNNNATQAGK